MTSTLAGFALAAAEGASGTTVDLVVVPSAYGDADKDRKENLALAQERTDQLDAACDAAVGAPYTGCTATLAVLFNRADALDPANSAALAAPATDGIYVLGGDQGIAMQVLADSPAEDAITAAVEGGAVLGGTSAGAAVESRNMINGYTGSLGPADGLRAGVDPDVVGRRRRPRARPRRRLVGAIFDQHFYQRGRFGRTLSTIATADERFGGASPVGVGVDYATGVRDTGDTSLSGLFGESSVGLVDLETLGATHTWVGSPATLSARKVLTHLMTDGTTYDLSTRVFTRGGAALAAPAAPAGRPRHPPRASAAPSSSAAGRSAPTSSGTSSRRRGPSTPRRPRGSSSSAAGPARAAGQRFRAGREEGRLDRPGQHGGPRQQGLARRPHRRHGRRPRRRHPAALASTMADPAFRDAVTTAVQRRPSCSPTAR